MRGVAVFEGEVVWGVRLCVRGEVVCKGWNLLYCILVVKDVMNTLVHSLLRSLFHLPSVLFCSAYH